MTFDWFGPRLLCSTLVAVAVATACAFGAYFISTFV